VSFFSSRSGLWADSEGLLKRLATVVSVRGRYQGGGGCQERNDGDSSPYQYPKLSEMKTLQAETSCRSCM